MTRTFIVEDEGLARRRLEKMTSAHHKLSLIEDSAKNGQEALDKIPKYNPELVFMDIELKDMTSFEVIEKLYPFDFKIIFVTAFSNYALKAFEVEAIDFLLKPFTEERFNKAVNRVISMKTGFNMNNIKQFLSNVDIIQTSRVIIPEGNTSHFFESNDMYYIISEGYYVNIKIESKQKLIRISLKKLEEILPKYFLRINKSTIINTNHIKEVVNHLNTNRIIMNENSEFYVSQMYKHNLIMILNKHRI